MNKSSTLDTGRDFRPLVLLVAGLFIVLVHFFHINTLKKKVIDSEPILTVDSFSWQIKGSSSEGVYLRDRSFHPPLGNVSYAGSSTHPKLAPFFFLPIPINSCDEELLLTISGIGPTLARRIIEFRQQNGAFKGEEDLMQIKGIGPAKLIEIRRSIVF